MADRDALLHRIRELELRLALAEQSGLHGSGGANSAVSAGAGTMFAERVASALTAIPLTSISERGSASASGATAADTPLIAKGEATSIDIAAASGKSATVDAAASTALVLVAYCVSGTALTLANKIAISAFPHPNMLLFIQNGVTLLLLWSGMRVWPSTFRTLLTYAGIEIMPCAAVMPSTLLTPKTCCFCYPASYRPRAPGATPPINMDAFRRWLPLVSLFVCMLVSSLFALKFVSAVTVMCSIRARAPLLRASI